MLFDMTELVCERDKLFLFFFFFSSRRRHTRFDCDWSSDVCSSDLARADRIPGAAHLPDQLLELGDARRVRTEERILVGECGLHRLEQQRADLTEGPVDAHAEARGEVAARDRARGGAPHRLPRPPAPPAPGG